jgi:hypothetical protein
MGHASDIWSGKRRHQIDTTSPLTVRDRVSLPHRVAQQARNLAIEGQLDNAGFLIRDRDAKFTSAFDEVFRTEDARVILTPIRAPRPTPSPSGSSEQSGTSCWTSRW